MFNLDNQVIKDFNNIQKKIKRFIPMARGYSKAKEKYIQLSEKLNEIDPKLTQLVALDWVDDNSELGEKVKAETEKLSKEKEEILSNRENLSKIMDVTGSEYEDYVIYIISYGHSYGESIIDFLESGDMKVPEFKDDDEKWAFWILIPQEEMDRIEEIDPSLDIKELQKFYNAIDI